MKVSTLCLAFLIGILALTGCGGPSAKVSGRVTGQDKAIVGNIMFSPLGEGASNKGESVTAAIKADGSYEIQLKTVGQHRIVVTPADIKYPVPEGEFDHPCDRTPQLHDIKQGDNVLNIELPVRTK